MSDLDDNQRENPGTYIVQDRLNKEELARIHTHDQILTTGMGGVLAEQPDPTIFHDVLDVACGTGGWLIEAAQTYPTISQLVGVDINGRIVDFARQQAAAQQLNERVVFRTMDALRLLEFASNSFDLVNIRVGMSFLRHWDWPRLLEEFKRICRAEGVIRVTEADTFESTSPALTRLHAIMGQVLLQSGHTLVSDGGGVTRLEHLLSQHRIKNVQMRVHQIEYAVGTARGEHFYEDMKRVFRTSLPFFRKWTRIPDDYEEIYQRMLVEMQQPEFTATWRLYTFWGNA